MPGKYPPARPNLPQSQFLTLCWNHTPPAWQCEEAGHLSRLLRFWACRIGECAFRAATVVVPGASISKDIQGAADFWCGSPTALEDRAVSPDAEREIAMIKPPLALSRASGIMRVLSVTLLFTTLLWASDPPWKGKPYQQWDLQDIHRILNDSPWARVAAITRTWSPITGNGLPNEQLAGRARGLPSSMDQSSASLAGDVSFFVFWDSSRVMRAAS